MGKEPCKHPIAASAWACAKTNVRLTSAVLRSCWKQHHEFTQNDLQCAIWAVATLRSSQAPLLELLVRSFVHNRETKLVAGFGNVFWALSRAGCLNQTMATTELQNQALSSLRWCSQRDLAGIAWACAFAPHDCRSFIEATAEVCVLRMSQFSARYLSNVFWALAKTSTWPKDQRSLWPNVARQLQEFQPQELAAVAWAAARTQSSMTSAVIQPFQDRVLVLAQQGQLGPQEFANLLWSFARLSCLQTSTCTELFHGVMARYHELQSQHIVSLVWTLASTKYYYSPFIERSAISLRFPRSFSHMESVGLAVSLAKLGAHNSSEPWVAAVCAMQLRIAC